MSTVAAKERSKGAWERHQDALQALEEARDVDTKRLLEGGGREALPGTSQEALEIDRKRLSLESSRTTMMRVMCTVVVTSFILGIVSVAMGGEEAIKGEGVDVVQPDGTSMDAKLGGLNRVKEVFRSVLSPPRTAISGLRKPEKSILMFGPPGCGKTEIAKAAAHERGYRFIEVTGGKIMGMYHGQSGQNIRRYFKAAKANAPCVLFFDEVETILKKRGGGAGRSEEDDRVVSEFLTEMNAVFDSPDRVIIVGATNLPETLDDAAVRRFHRRLYVPIPGKDGREMILKKEIPNLSGEALKKAVELTHGTSSSDLAACAKNLLEAAAMEAPRRAQKGELTKKDIHPRAELVVDTMKKCKSTVRSSKLAAYRQWAQQFGEKPEEEDIPKEGEHRPITAFDLDDEERKIAERAIRTPSKNAKKFSDLFGVENIQNQLVSAAVNTVMYQKQLREGTIAFDRAFLLYGPPGTGKSRIPEALAAEAFEQTKDILKKDDRHFSFLAFSAADIKGKYIGESEQNLARYFRVAEAYQPCVMFIDEIDTLLMDRAKAQANDGGASAALLGQFLQMMDGANVDPGRMVIVLAATNYPGNLDSAAARRLVPLHVRLPNSMARANLFTKAIYNQNFEQLGKEYRTPIEALASASQGYSGADITRLIQNARLHAFNSYLEKNRSLQGYDGELTAADLKYAFAVTPRSAKPEDVEQCDKFEGKYVKDNAEMAAFLEEERARGTQGNEEKEEKDLDLNDRVGLVGKISASLKSTFW